MLQAVKTPNSVLTIFVSQTINCCGFISTLLLLVSIVSSGYGLPVLLMWSISRFCAVGNGCRYYSGLL